MARATSRSSDTVSGELRKAVGVLIEAWPRGQPLGLAARYVGLGESTGLREVEEGRAPKPVPLTPGRVVWLREHLDAWLDDRAAQSEDRKRPNTWADFEP